MMPTRTIWILVLTVVVEEISATDPSQTKYTTKYELTFFENRLGKLNFVDARAACEERGSWLVKIDGADVNKAITDTIKVFSSGTNGYWIGANDKDVKGSWVWQDGTPAGRDGDNYHNWGGGEPNNPDTERCGAIGWWYKVWMNGRCSQTFYYICQKVGFNMMVSPTRLRITSTGPSEVKCTTTSSATTVRWRLPSGAHQPAESGASTLNLKNANISSAGTYRCEAWGYLGGERVEGSKNVEVTVYGPPTIDSVKLAECASELSVTWKPSSLAVGFEHRIYVNGSGQSWKSETPHSTNTVATSLAGLSRQTKYLVQVSACKDAACGGVNRAESHATTLGLPDPVKSTSMSTDEKNETCTVQWSTSAAGIESTEYKVTLTATIKKSRKFVAPNTLDETAEKDEENYLFTMQPNRKYTAVVLVENCRGQSKATTSLGVCESPVAAPGKLPNITTSPTRNDDGTWAMTIGALDERNGPVSCLFVIVKLLADGNSEEKKFSKENLRIAENGDAKKGYIAFAISGSSLSPESSKLQLGDGESSDCDTAAIEASRRKRRNTASSDGSSYNGENRKLDETQRYGIFLVSTTPTDSGDLLFGKGEITSIGEVKDASGSTGLIVGIVIAIVTIILIVVILILLIKRRREKRDIPAVNVESRQPREERVVYENFNSVQRGSGSETEIRMGKLQEVYNSLRDENGAGFQGQFQGILQEASQNLASTTFASNPALKKKNRYKNILPFDHSRVKLDGTKEGYINANFIHGFERQRKFIATQGPVPDTVNDFWLMVAEQRCTIIVMLAKSVEAGKKKCEVYWPGAGTTGTYGLVVVEARAEVNYSCYIKRTFGVKLANEARVNGLVVSHYQFMKWPDHGAPTTTSPLMMMYRDVMQRQEESEAPLVVHCSAGAGRSGTFIGFDLLVNQCQRLGSVDIYKCVLNMRGQRVEMVQTCEQYTLLHKLVLENHLFGDTDMDANQVERRLKNPNGSVNRQALVVEFNNLSKVGPMKNATSKAQAAYRKNMNRNKDIVPYDYCAVEIAQNEKDAEQPYINASWVQCYDESSPMIAAQGPMDETIENFWRAVLDNNVETIVMLTEVTENKKEQCAQYWPDTVGESLRVGQVTVKLMEEKFDGSVIERRVQAQALTRKKTVTQLHYLKWTTNTCPEDSQELINLINKMQEKTRSSSGAATIIHCSDGSGRTGTFCAIVNLLERLKLENRVDVFSTVKDLRDGRPGMVQTLDQYIFCYQAVLDYLKSFELYSNFGRN